MQRHITVAEGIAAANMQMQKQIQYQIQVVLKTLHCPLAKEILCKTQW